MPFWRFGVASERSTSEPLARFRAEHADDWNRAKTPVSHSQAAGSAFRARLGSFTVLAGLVPAIHGRAGSMKIPKWLRRRNGLRTPAGAIIP
jgi:hypothetical protein